MSHTHKVNDRDPYFEIDAVTRKIMNKSASKVSVIQYDHNSERFTFSLPRYIEDHDMLESTKAEVHYICAKSQTKGIYEMTDLAVDPEDENKVICTWLLSQNVTLEAGAINFLLRFSCVAEDGTIEYAWNTAIFTGISVAEGIYNTEAIVEQYADILEQWKAEINSYIDDVVDENRTHYEESVLVCDYTATYNLEDGEMGESEEASLHVELSDKLDFDNLEMYVNGELVVPIVIGNDDGSTDVMLNDEWSVFCYDGNTTIRFYPIAPKGTHVELYQEDVVKLDGKYIPKLTESHMPDIVPKMTECEKELICQYTYDSADYSDGDFVGIVVNKKLTKENFTVYVNGEKVNDISFSEESYTDGSFFAFYESIIFYNYTDDTVVFYPLDTDGTVIQIYEENFNILKDKEISNAIARTQYVDKRVDAVEGQIGDVETALDAIIAIQNELIGGDSE